MIKNFINKKVDFKRNNNKAIYVSKLIDKVRKEIKKGLLKDKILNDDDRILLQQFYLKIQNEFKDLEK